MRVAVLEGLQLLVDNQHAQPVLKVSLHMRNSYRNTVLRVCLQMHAVVQFTRSTRAVLTQLALSRHA